jgi:hypothetical protein
MPAEEARMAALCRRLAREHDELLAWLRQGYSLRQAELLLEAPRRTARQSAPKSRRKGNHRAHRGHRDQK